MGSAPVNTAVTPVRLHRMDDPQDADALVPAKPQLQRTRGLLPVCIIGALWLTLVALLALLVSAYAPHFEIMRQRGELPAVTERLISLAASNRVWLFIPSGAILAAVLITERSLARLLDRSENRWVYWAWFLAVVLAELLAITIIYMGTAVAAARTSL